MVNDSITSSLFVKLHGDLNDEGHRQARYFIYQYWEREFLSTQNVDAMADIAKILIFFDFIITRNIKK